MFTEEMFNQMKSEKIINLSNEEEAYRRGYCHGFLAAKRSNVTEEEIYAWRNGNELTAPPGSCMGGQKLDGLTVEDQHRFFGNRLKEQWNK